MRRLEEKNIKSKAIEAFNNFLNGKTIDEKKYSWSRSVNKGIVEFYLYDHSMYDNWGVVDKTRKELVLDGEEENKIIHLLTIYVDRFTGETFVKRVAKKMPWED